MGRLYCWSCGCETSIITRFEVAHQTREYGFTVPDLNSYPDLVIALSELLPSDIQIGLIRRRYSKTQGRSYLSNGCAHCGALIGEFFEHDAWEDQRVVGTF